MLFYSFARDVASGATLTSDPMHVTGHSQGFLITVTGPA